MARFSKAALLKWLEAAIEDAAKRRDAMQLRKHRESTASWYDGQWTAYAQLAGAIERGEIGEEK